MAAAAARHAKLSAACTALLVSVLLLQALAEPAAAAACSVDAIYSFGDSIADTGNLLREGPVGFFANIGSYPYGQTLRKPTGRCSDGLLIVDYLAMALNLPLVSPYMDKAADFSGGVNFAVAGATALDRVSLLQSGVMMPPASVPLSSQLDWFKSYLNATCSAPEDCARKLANALFLVGEIGGNDYNYAFFQGIRSVESVKSYVPQVVNAIMDVTKELIELGATQIIIPGNFPIGCSPSYLSLFSSDRDERGCLRSYNSFAQYHNEQLQAAIDGLRKVNTDINIIYADYYGAFMHLIDHASILGARRCPCAAALLAVDLVRLPDTSPNHLARHEAPALSAHSHCKLIWILVGMLACLTAANLLALRTLLRSSLRLHGLVAADATCGQQPHSRAHYRGKLKTGEVAALVWEEAVGLVGGRGCGVNTGSTRARFFKRAVGRVEPTTST